MSFGSEQVVVWRSQWRAIRMISDEREQRFILECEAADERMRLRDRLAAISPTMAVQVFGVLQCAIS